LSCGTETQSRPGNFAGAATTPKEKGTSTMTTATATASTVKFQAGVSYYCRSICNYDCVWHFRIIRRTAASVWVLVNGEEVRRGVEVWEGVEQFAPFGRYSMSPTVSADRRSITVAGFEG
jgi:hypothetical protein